MNEFQINANAFLSTPVRGFYHVPYTRMNMVGNPDYINDLKNTFNNFSDDKLCAAYTQLSNVLLEDLPQIIQMLAINPIVVCVVPRAKAENEYEQKQQLFRAAVQALVASVPGFVDGTNYLRRHTNTKTTHLRKPIPNYKNDGLDPYPGITRTTCNISPDVAGKHILLIDDIYTPTVNIDEDAINSLLIAGAKTVTFYAVGKV